MSLIMCTLLIVALVLLDLAFPLRSDDGDEQMDSQERRIVGSAGL